MDPTPAGQSEQAMPTKGKQVKDDPTLAPVLMEMDTDQGSQQGLEDLSAAIENGDQEVAMRLLESGDRDKLLQSGRGGNSDGKSVLHLAAANGIMHVVRTLLEWGAPCDPRDDSGRTPLHLAAKNGHVDVVQVLLEKGAQAHAEDLAGITALQLAAENCHEDVVSVLLIAIPKDPTDEAIKKAAAAVMHLAAKCGNANIVKDLLIWGVKVENDGILGTTAMHTASESGELLEVLQSLFRFGRADAHSVDKRGQTPLHVAAMKGNKDAVEFLLSKGAPVNATDRAGKTALHYAVSTDSPAAPGVIEMLLRNRAHVKYGSKLGLTALHLASSLGHATAVTLLLKAQADVDARDVLGATALHRAAENGHEEIVRLLLNGGATMAPEDYTLSTPLHYSAKRGHNAIVEMLAPSGFAGMLDARDQDGATPLHLAVGNGHVNIVKNLLDRGANVNAVDDQYRTALMIAAGQDVKELVQLLIAKGADLYAKDALGDSAIRYAAKNATPKASQTRDSAPVRCLVSKDDDDCRDVYTTLMEAVANSFRGPGRPPSRQKFLSPQPARGEALKDVHMDLLSTPLHQAAKRGDVAAVKKLSASASPLIVNARDHTGATALHVAAQQGHTEVVQLLLDRGARIAEAEDRFRWTALHYGALHGHISVVETLLASPSSRSILEARDDADATPLLFAARYGHAQVAKALLQHGANVNAADSLSRETPLLSACSKGAADVVEAILDFKPRLDAVDSRGMNAAMIAARLGHQAVVEVLIKREVPLNGVDKRGRTALDHAANAGHTKVYEMLREAAAVDISPDRDVSAEMRCDDNEAEQAPVGRHNLSPEVDVVQLRRKGINSMAPDSDANQRMELVDDDEWFADGETAPLGFAPQRKFSRNKGINKAGSLLEPFRLEIFQWDRRNRKLGGGTVDGQTELMLAAQSGHIECVKALLQAGADTEKIDHLKRTALMLAEAEGHADCVEALRKRRKKKRSAAAKSLAATSGKSNPSTLDGAAQNGSEGERANDDIAAQEMIPEPKLPPTSATPIPDIKPQQDGNPSPHLPAISLVQGKSKIATKLLVGNEKKGDFDWLANILDRAQRKWLNSDDILKIMARYREIEQQDGLWPEKAARYPQGGDIFLFSRKLCPNFRADGHTFKKSESHVKLRVNAKPSLQCYYCQAIKPAGLRRRIYRDITAPKSDIVLLHYLQDEDSGERQDGNAEKEPNHSHDMLRSASIEGQPTSMEVDGDGADETHTRGSPRPYKKRRTEAVVEEDGTAAIDKDAAETLTLIHSGDRH